MSSLKNVKKENWVRTPRSRVSPLRTQGHTGHEFRRRRPESSLVQVRTPRSRVRPLQSQVHHGDLCRENLEKSESQVINSKTNPTMPVMVHYSSSLARSLLSQNQVSMLLQIHMYCASVRCLNGDVADPSFQFLCWILLGWLSWKRSHYWISNIWQSLTG